MTVWPPSPSCTWSTYTHPSHSSMAATVSSPITKSSKTQSNQCSWPVQPRNRSPVSTACRRSSFNTRNTSITSNKRLKALTTPTKQKQSSRPPNCLPCNHSTKSTKMKPVLSNKRRNMNGRCSRRSWKTRWLNTVHKYHNWPKPISSLTLTWKKSQRKPAGSKQ